MAKFKLFMLLLGCKPPGRHTEQHDVFFGIASSLQELIPEIEAFWQEPDKIHIDDKYGIDVDDLYQIEDILSPSQKEKYQIELFAVENLTVDPINVGYLKLSRLAQGNLDTE